MIRVTIFRRDEGARRGIVGFTVRGHAGVAPKGKDVVCAGVSAIAQAALMGLEEMLGDGVQAETGEGFLKVTVDQAAAADPGPASILRTLELGLLSIGRGHPGSVTVTYQ